jgi:hypothetical protein
MKNFTEILKKEIDSRILEIELGEQNVIKKSLAAIEILTEAMNQLKKFIKNYTFKDEAEEIHFFKEVKPHFLFRLIYYKAIYNLDMNCPTNSIDAKREYYRHELSRLDDYAKRRIDFVRYYRSGATIRDREMFLRNQNSMSFYLDSFRFERDEDFSSNHDFHVAKFMANDLIQIYINSELQQIENHKYGANAVFPKVKLTWTSKKTDLIELLYALDAAGSFNSGSISLNQIAAYFENVFNTDLSNFARDFYVMRVRLDRTSFMDRLKSLLKKRMDNPKEPYRT